MDQADAGKETYGHSGQKGHEPGSRRRRGPQLVLQGSQAHCQSQPEPYCAAQLVVVQRFTPFVTLTPEPLKIQGLALYSNG